MMRNTRYLVPADIAVFAGDFASQPLVFAHLLDTVPSLDLDHVQVIQSNHAKRLAAYFTADTVVGLPGAATLVLILPAAFAGLDCPLTGTALLRPVGVRRGTIPGSLVPE